MIPMLRICSLLETIFRMSAELLKRGNESYLSNRRDSANLYGSLLYIAPEKRSGNHWCDESSISYRRKIYIGTPPSSWNKRRAWQKPRYARKPEIRWSYSSAHLRDCVNGKQRCGQAAKAAERRTL